MPTILIKILVKFIIFFVIPVVIGISLAPKAEWISGMSFGQWYENTAECQLGSPGCTIDNANVCWSCKIFSQVIDFFSSAVTKAFNFMSDDLIVLILLGTALWFAWFTFQQLTGKEEVNGTEYFKTILKRLIRITIIIFILGGLTHSKGTNILQNTTKAIIDPIFAIHTGIVQQVFNFDEGVCPTFQDDKNGVISSGVKSSLLCTTGMMSMMVKGGMQIAGNLIFFGRLESVSFLSAIVGAYIYGVFLLFQIMLPFMLLDILITIIIPLFFLPLLLTGFAFKGTDVEAHLKKGLDIIVSAAFKMVAISIALSFVYIIYTNIGDAFFPGPKDNFSYLAPNYLERPENRTPSEIEQKFNNCSKLILNSQGALTNSQKNSLKACYKQIPNPENEKGIISLLILYMLMKITIKIFQSIYGKISSFVKADSLNLGTKIYDGASTIVKKGISMAKKGIDAI